MAQALAKQSYSVSKRGLGFALCVCVIGGLLMLAMNAPVRAAYLLLLISTVLTVLFSVKFVCHSRIDSIFLVYLITYGLYGLAAPLNVIFYEGHFPRYAFTPENLGTLAEVYALGLLAILFTSVFFFYQFPPQPAANTVTHTSSYQFLTKRRSIPYILALLASVSYMQTLGTAGFTSTIFLGKGYFSALVGDQYFSFFTTPLAFAAIYLYFSPPEHEVNRTRTGALLLALCLSPLILFYMLTGERSSILSMAIVWMLSVALRKNIRFKFKYVVYGLTFFLMLTLIYSGRSWVPAFVMGQSDWKGFKSESIIKNFNPANSEFHAGSGNFTTFIQNPQETELPSTYPGVFLHLFPRWALPFTKPTEISIWFNRTYYPELESINVRVGFSSWVEGFMNGGRLGLFFHFLLTTALALGLDRIRTKARSPFAAFIPIALSALFIKFHRTSLAVFAGYTFETVVVWSLVFFMLMFLFQRRS